MTEDYRLAHELDRVLRQIDARMNRQMARTDKLGIGQMGCLALMHLDDAQPCSTQDLATRMGRDTSQMARVLRHLESKGVVVRAPSKEDGRVTFLSISDTGAHFVKELKSVMSRVVDEVCAPLKKNQRSSLIELLELI